MRSVIIFVFLPFVTAFYKTSWREHFETLDEPKSSNLGCFLCTQLLSVAKHRVGLSEDQLRTVMVDKCRVINHILKDPCMTLVEQSLPEIYFSLNYDFSSKNVCVQLKLCDPANPFVNSGGKIEEVPAKSTTLSPPSSSPDAMSSTQSLTAEQMSLSRKVSRTDSEKEDTVNAPARKRTMQYKSAEVLSEADKHATCVFCEKLLENAKKYAVTAKTDITTFADSSCARMPKGTLADECYGLADRKIEQLARFVDEQVVEALWCAEVHQC